MEKEYSFRIGELAEATGVTRRTIHYYVGRGLLPPPMGAGLGTTYGAEHYFRILLVKRMQQSFWPLDEIRSRLASLTLAEVQQALELGVGVQPNDVVPQQRPESTPDHPKIYERIDIGDGIEIHLPKERTARSDELVGHILTLVKKIRNEV